MSNISTRIAVLACLFVVVIAMLVAAPVKGDQFQCISGSNIWKNDSGGIYTAPDGYTIASVWVKAGQNCYELPHACYEIVSGGIGYGYVEVVKAGDCQDLSHLEGTFEEEPTNTPEPTMTLTATPMLSTATPTSTLSPTETPTTTPEPSITPTIIDPTITPTSEITPTPYPTKECQIEQCNGLG